MTGTTTNQRLMDWVDEWAQVLCPSDVHWCDGTLEEYEQLCAGLVEQWDLHALDEATRPNSYWAHSDPGDVARVETARSSAPRRETSGRPEHNWRQPGRDARRAHRSSTGGR
jgi:phosphoenolpyruvate carboxykinase (GTP)